MYSNIYAPQDNLLQVSPSIGGYCNLYVVPLEHIDTWPAIDPLTGVLAAAPSLITGKSWLGIENMPGNAIYKEDEQDSSAGPWFAMSVVAPLADDNQAQVLRTMALRHHRLVVMIEEHNGMVRIMGSADAAATMKQSYTSADDEGTRQRILTINWESSSNAVLVNAEALELIEFSNEYSYDFN